MSNPWWSVDLQDSYEIESVKVFNRVDCCSSRLSDFKLQIYNGGSEEYIYNHVGWPGYETVINMPMNTIWDEVKISLSGDNKILSLAEVEVEAKEKYSRQWHSICHKMMGVVDLDEQKCPSNKSVNQDNCIAAGLAVGGKQIGRNSLSIVKSWFDERPSGCFMPCARI